MLLSACLIVKNEAQTLGKCLSSLQDVVDEMIVVDTGSSDETIAIAQSHGASVHVMNWEDDFSQARNESLRHAQGDWILVIDADEYLDQNQKIGLREFLQTTNAEGVFVTQRNYLGSLQNITKVSPVRVMRLFRRGHFYRGTIHEQIAISVEQSGKPMTQFELDLHHLGYLDEFVKQRSKSERNTWLLEKALAKEPDSIFHRGNLIAEYLLNKEYDMCADLAESTFRLIRKDPIAKWPTFAARIMFHWMIALGELNQRDRAIQRAEEGIGYFPWLTDMKKKLAEMLVQEGRLLEAERVLMQCREQGDTKSGFIDSVEGAGTYLAAADLGAVWSRLGDDLVARKWYLQAFIENPTLSMCVMPLVCLMPADEAFLSEHIESRIVDAATNGNYAEVYAVRNISGAKSVIDRAEQRWGPSESTQRARMASMVEEGMEKLMEHVEHSPHESNWLRLGLRCMELADMTNARRFLARAGIRGEYFLKTHDLLSTTSSSEWEVQYVIRDMVAMKSVRLLREWLPFAKDRHDAWIYLKYSPLSTVLAEIEWPGNTLYECECNAMRCFQNQNFLEAETWLTRAKRLGSTVTQVLISCDLVLAKGDIATARRIVYEGKKQFPASVALKNASDTLHPKVDPFEFMARFPQQNADRRFVQ